MDFVKETIAHLCVLFNFLPTKIYFNEILIQIIFCTDFQKLMMIIESCIIFQALICHFYCFLNSFLCLLMFYVLFFMFLFNIPFHFDLNYTENCFYSQHHSHSFLFKALRTR